MWWNYGLHMWQCLVMTWEAQVRQKGSLTRVGCGMWPGRASHINLFFGADTARHKPRSSSVLPIFFYSPLVCPPSFSFLFLTFQLFVWWSYFLCLHLVNIYWFSLVLFCEPWHVTRHWNSGLFIKFWTLPQVKCDLLIRHMFTYIYIYNLCLDY